MKPEEEKAYEKERTERFELRLPNDVRDLLAAASEGAKPVFADALPGTGAFLVTMVRGSPVVEARPGEVPMRNSPTRALRWP